MNAPRSNIRPAASVLVLRDGPRGVELLLMRRPERGDNDFRSGACVFPGGVLDAADRDAWRWCLGQDDAQASARLGLAEAGLDYFVAALRECFEEVGLLFVCRPDGSPVELAPHAQALAQWRHRLHRGEARLSELCAAFDWRLDLRDMAYFSHWLTPALRPKRFDTRFFVRLAPPGQQALPDLGEALELLWLTPDEALDPQRALKLLNVTQRTLQDMRGFASAHAAYEHALALRGVALHLPRPALTRAGQLRFVIEDHPAYDEIGLLDPDARGGLHCELQPGEVQRLSPRLLRVAGQRRHAYVVTDTAGSEAAIVDADPADAPQWQAVQAAAPQAVRWLLFLAAGALEARATLAARWPAAQVWSVSAAPDPARGDMLGLGADTRLEPVAGGLRIVEDGVLLVGDARGAEPLRNAAADWTAGSRGFLQRLRSG
ncbi:MAG TPA: NUDIX domain-containing protein [Rubrivivax sp.]|nr:NUDIX domain-containing protein [Rubrivivax sp.]